MTSIPATHTQLVLRASAYAARSPTPARPYTPTGFADG